MPRIRDQVLIAELHTHPPGAGGQNEVVAAYDAVPYRDKKTLVAYLRCAEGCLSHWERVQT